MCLSFYQKRKVKLGCHRTMGYQTVLTAGLLSVSIMLSGCTLFTTTDDSAKTKTAEQTESQVVAAQENGDTAKKSENNLSLNSATMFEILAAEMMMQKGQAATAFAVLYPLALQTNDRALAERTFQAAMASYNVANIEKATEHWKTVAPDSPVAWRASLLLTLRNGEVVKALEEWDTYLKLADSPLADELISIASKVSSTVPKEPGTEFFQALTQKYPDEWAAYYGLGMVSIVYQNPEVGIVALEKAKPLLPKKDYEQSLPVFYNLLSKLYLMSGEPERGIEAISPYLEQSPEDLLIQERVARLEVQAKRYAEAEQRYQYILKAEPDAHTSLLSLALIQMELTKYEPAEQNLIKVKQNKLYESVGNYYLGILYQDNGQNDLAEQMFKQVESDNYQIDAQLHLSEIYFAQKNSQKAFEVLDSIEANSVEERVKVLRAKAIFKSADDQYQDAIALYSKALDLDESNIEMLKAQSLLFFKLDKLDDYEANLLKVLKIDANDTDALNALGYYYVEEKIKLDQAYLLLKKAISLEPDSYYILDSLGWYYFQVEQFDQALDYLNRAFAIEKDEEVFIHLVMAYWQNKEVNRAKLLWKKYHKNFLQNDRVQNLINELELGNTK
ncbi:MAG: tetratricopeptide repeat protein [Thiomicrorhabdus sp.]|nr:tetratricopeptide repeat protein [Thiomicrorhabdus sp.]